MTTEEKKETQQENDEFEKDKVAKQGLVLETITSYCTKDSSIEDLRRIAYAIEDKNETLKIENLSGGYTNFTYKVFLSSGTVSLFVKLCFSRALWNPDPDFYYDVERITNEYKMMKKFNTFITASSSGCCCCVARPYLLIDIQQDMKLLVTQWSPQDADEQLANQFIDGIADVRVAKNLATAVATLHTSSDIIDTNFNTEARECMLALFPTMKEKMFNELKEENNSRVSQLLMTKEYGGQETITTIVDECTNNYRAKEIPVHADLHSFNCLVEKKPSIQDLEQFGPNGIVVICDWEMSMFGPIGIDNGRIFSVPVACIIVHTMIINSTDFDSDDDDDESREIAKGILNFIDTYWKEYTLSVMKKKGGEGKDTDNFLIRSYINSMGWLGWKLYAMCTFDWFIPFFPIADNKDDISIFKESIGVIALKLMKWGFLSLDTNNHNNNDNQQEESLLSLDKLQARFHSIIQDEISIITSDANSNKRPRDKSTRRRRSSILRETNRRVSDSSFYSFKGKGRPSFTSGSIIDDDFKI